MAQNHTEISLEAVLGDPASTCAHVRQQGGVAQLDDRLLFASHELVTAGLKSPSFGPGIIQSLRLLGVTSGPFFEFIQGSSLNASGESHRNWRRQLTNAFTPRSMDALRPHIRREADQLVSAACTRGECEFMDAFARPLPALALCELLGVPPAARSHFSQLADTMGIGFNPALVAAHIAEVNAAVTELGHYALSLVKERQANPTDDLVGRLVQAAQEEGRGFDAVAIKETLIGLLFAGYETTKGQLGWMIMALSERPDLWDAVSATPELAKPIVEEVLRLRGATAGVNRQTTTEVTIGGHTIAAGTTVYLHTWSANRDETSFPAADRLEPSQNNTCPHLTFGLGAHFCIGASMARAELQESLIAWSTRVHCPEIVGDVPISPPIGLFGPSRLPIRFQPRA